MVTNFIENFLWSPPLFSLFKCLLVHLFHSKDEWNSDNITNTFTLPSTKDPTSLYIIHPSENPTLPLVLECFNEVGYGEQKRSMIITLSTKNKRTFVDNALKNRLKMTSSSLSRRDVTMSLFHIFWGPLTLVF